MKKKCDSFVDLEAFLIEKKKMALNIWWSYALLTSMFSYVIDVVVLGMKAQCQSFIQLQGIVGDK